MKRIFAALIPAVLLVGAPALRAFDDGGDGAFIPSYRELQREGYTSDRSEQPDTKPTQAFHMNGVTIYYGYTPLPVNQRYFADERQNYAFGYPVSYFKERMSNSVMSANIDRYALAVDEPAQTSGEGDFNANGGHDTAITYVKPAKQKTSVENIAATQSAGKTPKPAAIALRATAPVQKPMVATSGTGEAMLPPIGEKPPDDASSSKPSN